MRIWPFFVALCFFFVAQAQNTETDSLKRLLIITKEDTSRVLIYEGLSYAYQYAYPDTAFHYALKGLQLARKINDPKGEAYCINALGNVYYTTGDYNKALETYLQALKIRERLHDERAIAVTYSNIGNVYSDQGEHRQAISYISKTKQFDEKIKDSSGLLIDLFNLGSIYNLLKNTDSALFYTQRAYEIAKSLNDRNYIGAIMNTFGSIYENLARLPVAISYFRQAISYSKSIKDQQVLSAAYYGLAVLFNKQGLPDSSIFYSRLSLETAKEASLLNKVLDAGLLLSSLFKTAHSYDSAFNYQELSIKIKDSLFNVERIKQIQKMGFQEQQRQQSIENARLEYGNKIKLYLVLVALAVFLLLAFILWRNNIGKQKANVILQQQKEKVESTLSELKATQAQLIQSEKMASLGELTAGIAHEIQNPLNFVNNFSEVNTELIDELKNELNTGNKEQAISIADDIKENEEKINHHGKRADAIVKGMLEHSRSSSGVKEPTDINALADEYLRLAYHGLKAKDKSFNATLKTSYDESIGNINIIPQDIERVLLNLYNNAFYAVNEKTKTPEPRPMAGSEEYEPTVTVSTKSIKPPPGGGGLGGLGVLISVKDNGSGIPQKVLDKIFQPFFTTKPTGQGTGLGLSLSYDIVKAHGGELKVETKEGEGSEFIIQLPTN